jgi:hypothetical protein
VVVGIGVLGGGCVQRGSVFSILDHREPGQTLRYTETFPRGYYDVDPHGNVDVVLTRTGGDADTPLQQVIHIRTLWRPIPGETVAHETQINGTVVYYITSGRTGAVFEGAGAVFFEENRKRTGLSGSVELAALQPSRRPSDTQALFERAEVRGKFYAVRDPLKTVRLVHDVQRQFGGQGSALGTNQRRPQNR